MAKPKSRKSCVGAGPVKQDLPKGWPASCKYSYGAAGQDLVPGNTIRQSCNGDIFLKKRAVQSASTDFPVLTGDGKVANGKTAPTRFLVIFPGRLNLKIPDDDCAADKPDDEAANETDPTEPAKKKSPFAPANPPHLLGKLVSLGGEDMELRMPFPASSDGEDTPVGESKRNHLIMSGKAIPLAGKYMSLSVKRVGKASTAGGNSGKKRGGGSLHCKDVFRSVIVLGESKFDDGGGDKVVSPNDDEEMNHYGASSRSLDGGAGQTTNKRGPSVESLTSRISPKPKRASRCNKSSSESEDEVSEGEEILDSHEGSDAEFVFKVNGKRKSRAGDSDGEDDGEKLRKRTPRRSVSSKKVTYVDVEEDADEMTSDSESSAGASSEGETGMKGKAAPPKRSTSVARASVPSKGQRKNTSKKVDVIELDADSCSSAAPSKPSPLRRKKHKSPSKKRKSQLETIDLYDKGDDEFRFLG